MLISSRLAENCGFEGLTIPDSFTWAEFGRRLAQHPSLSGKLDGCVGMVADLDNTLIDSHEAWHSFNLVLAKQLGVDDEPTLRKMHDELRGQPADVYLPAFFKVCTNLGSAIDSYPDFFARRQQIIESIASGQIPLTQPIPQVPDAQVLLRALKLGLGKEIKVATHAPRILAVPFAQAAGYEGVWDFSAQMTCENDVPFGKNEPAYWKRILGNSPPQAWLGAEDTPSGARWMLEIADLALVIARPSSPKYLAEFVGLRARHPDRLIIVEEYGDLLGS